MSGTRYANVTPRTEVYAAQEMLDHAMPTMVLEKFGRPYKMPKRKTDTIEFNRPVVFDAATTPLLEGVTPNLTQFRYEKVPGRMRQYGQVVEITDIIEDFAEDDVAADAFEICGDNIGRTSEALDWAVLRAGTNVFYSNGTSRADVNTPISLAKQQAVTRAMRRNKAKKITKVLSAEMKFNTSPVDACYVGLAHSDLDTDIRRMPGFIPVEKYGEKTKVCDEEIGAVEHVRYVLSEDLDPFLSAGATPTGVKSGNGTDADVYPVLFVGANAYGRVALRGETAVTPTIIPVGKADKSDPLAQRGYIGWKMYHLCMILNQLWMARLEVAVSEL